ncbi:MULTISPECIES: maleylpyruvate isomerase family mycothiol-dependent enzyme [Streptomycetaceae]|uniref:Maleylpyruvate isomerase family mycothiol-dependent enzyme n=1 Tax=Streptantibioticus cattleyicolor (strain ATCC 35852 / DSM 46488 / JCM 4925 / NBRC 14057 / NRRL 8057) TaxID=1003195 RepID=F8K367_STREN|nr:maleylpyruvate isomerase family mycothiol-dependent enzyme [Streptantibioticus cattleyicolor]AEW93780.1 hypothetical protein SCATT_14090 [Streptantibioticus cattleyicolor NRRL 8057 = DSM 46488]MYS58466.1 maleylpyruvate isomerase family mycothiol-dependent enzyme [Streptomyces sp. SID5468]CCB74126.1 conserved protein of unknown function [Streptantibioticus cattleyicolor NRRL 8057 = DSM 46488]
MPVLDHDAYLSQLTAEADRLREVLRDADPGAHVPTCPDWSLAELIGHLGGVHRWVTQVVTTRAQEPLRRDLVAGDEPPKDAEGLARWLGDGVTPLVAALREAGPDTRVWSWAGVPTTAFWSRRMVLETLVHRADAAIALQRPYDAPAELAADAIDEWLELMASESALRFRPQLAELRGDGERLHLHATDAPAQLNAEWVVERTPQGITWRREHAKGDVALRAPLTDLFLAFHRRLPLDHERLEIIGDRALLDHWLEHTAF